VRLQGAIGPSPIGVSESLTDVIAEAHCTALAIVDAQQHSAAKSISVGSINPKHSLASSVNAVRASEPNDRV
jgi:hypothetical protein